MATAKLLRSITPVAAAVPARLANHPKTPGSRVRGVYPGEAFGVSLEASAVGEGSGWSDVFGKVRFWYW